MKSGNRSTWKRLFYSPIGIIFGCFVFIFIIRGGWSVHQKALQAQQRLNQAQTELIGLQHQQASLSASISQLSTTEGIEAALREKYHAVKQGESVAVIIDSSNTSPQNIKIDESSTSEKISWWGSVLQFIGF